MGSSIYKVEMQGKVTIITLTADNITMFQNEELKKAFSDLLDKGNKDIVLDLSNTSFISTIIIASLVSMLKRSKDAGGNFVICGIKDKVKEVLEMTNLNTIFDIADNKEKAVKKFSKK